jgi:hypothetical protein
VLSGMVLLSCAYGIIRENRSAAIIGAMISVILGAKYYDSISRHFRIMPDLILVVLSAISLILVVSWIFRNEGKRITEF